MTPRVGSMWWPATGYTSVVAVTGHTDDGRSVTMRAIIDGELIPQEREVTVPLDGDTPVGFRYLRQQPTLRCVDEAAAVRAVAHLHVGGASASVRVGRYVIVAVTPPGVIGFAELALSHGWADDGDCARLIADLG